MHGFRWAPEPELLASDDPERWAAQFAAHAWRDPLFAADEQVVAYWFGCAILAAKTAGLAEADARLTRLRRGLLLNRVLLSVLIVLSAAWLIWLSLEAAGAAR